MANKSFLTRLKEADALTSSIEQEADGLGADLEEMLRPVLRETETMPDMALSVRLLGRALALRRDEMKASNARTKEIAEAPTGPRRVRRATAKLRAMVYDFRVIFDSTYGPGTVQRLFGVSGRTPRNSHALELMVEAIIRRLRNPEVKYPPPLDGVHLRHEQWGSDFEPLLKALKDAHKEVNEEIRDGQGALVDKHRDQKAYDEYFKPLGWVVKGLYTMTGRLQLFKKLPLGAPKRAPKKNGPAADPRSESGESSGR